ncbi:hypothetical protein EWM64_g1902 [Hericium alpestre]|uniref:Uncharacterized protein n=1 Tax=Hericium alpestre TaxID=135208 RepID=A0A4Z0A768_9AGAM|nr:hypothetical protein EWM64_g1902 [Hericium alpestre]
MIDPDLLALSIPSGDVQSFGDQAPSGIVAPATPTLVQSPEASMASFGGPPTPQWDEMHPEPTIHTGEPEPAPASAPTMPATSFQQPDFSCVQMLPAQQNPHFPPPHPQALSTPPLPYPMPSGSTPVPASSAAFASTSRLLSVLDSKRVAQGSAARGTNKQDIIRRAKERRAQLQAELERAKVELWETTIEQGALAHIAKDTAVI